MSDTWVTPTLARLGVSPRMLDVLRDIARPHRARKLPAPGASVVYDRCYERAAAEGRILWVQVHEHHTSLADDHYVLTDAGRRLLDIQRADEQGLETPAPRRDDSE